MQLVLFPALMCHRWRCLAAGGCLVFALALPSSAQAQEGVAGAERSPAVQGEGGEQAQRSQQPSGRFAVPVRIIEDSEGAERAEKREADDLAAQQRSAAAAERAAIAGESQKVAAWWQVGVASVGTFVLLYTLWLTRWSVRQAGRSADAANAAVKVAESTAERQLRAYVGVADDRVEMISPGFQPMVSLEIKNFGQTPAHHVIVWTEISVMERGAAVFEEKSDAEPGRRVLNPGAIMTVVSIKDEALTDDEFGRTKADTARLYCFGTIRFTDAFGRPRTTKFRYETRGGRIVAMERLTLSDEGNEAD